MTAAYDIALDARAQTPPLVSVIIPCFNGEKELGRLIDSIRQQTGTISYELIFCDDCSADNTVSLILAAIASHSLPALVLRRRWNGGVAHARNNALTESRGTLVCFLDHDDTWHPIKLLRTVQTHALLTKPTISFHLEHKVARAEPAIPLTYVHEEYFRTHCPRSHLFRVNFISTSTVCISGAIARSHKFDPTLAYAEDYDYWLGVAAHSDLVLIDEYLGVSYTNRDTSLSLNARNVFRSHLRILTRHLPDGVRRHGPRVILNVVAQLWESLVRRNQIP